MAKSSAMTSRTVTQVGIIVRDIEKTSKAYAELFGVDVPAWILTDTVDKAHTLYKGKPSTAQAKLAFFNLDNLDVELIEPVGGPSTWKEFLDRHGEGVHHIAFVIQGTEKQIRLLEGVGLPVEQRGDYTGGCYTYIGSQDKLGVALELLENFS